MKTRETIPGKTYSVHTSSGCTVSDKNGWSKTIDAPDGYFTAHAGEVTIDGDDAADVRELFKLAPYQKLRLLGVVGGNVPAWFKALETELTALLDGSKFKLAWLAGENKLVVHTDRISDELGDAVTALLERVLPQNVEVVRYNHNMEISWRDAEYKYAHCTNVEDMYAVNSQYKHDVTSEGEWVYQLPEMVNFGQRYPTNNAEDGGFGCKYWTGEKSSLITFKVPMPKATNLDSVFRGTITLRYLNLNVPNAKTLDCVIWECRELEYVEIYTECESQFSGYGICNAKAKKLKTARLNFPRAKHLVFGTAPALTELELDMPLANSCVLFDGSQVNKESSLRLFNSLPAYTSGSHLLTIGIHIDHKQDDEVLEAIANAEAKGWTLTVQWNGTPTAQASVTYGLRKPPIYAKVAEMERPDGTTEQFLDWGHYVTDPTGYEEFRSVEAAREYFGLPEEDLTNN